MPAEYLLRLDDACPTMDAPRWRAVEDVLVRHRITPIVAVVPANEDPALVRGNADDRFWSRARSWAAAGWMMAMHGYTHALRPSGRGIVPLNPRSEFVGLAPEEQKRRIRESARAFQAEGLTPEAWVAPAHGMDRRTLEALRTETDIRIISDSFALHPVRRWGFVWIPQQLWRPRPMPGGLWTVCLHPNEMNAADVQRLAAFVAARKSRFVSPRAAAARATPLMPADVVLGSAFFSLLKIRRLRGSHNGRS